MITPKVSIVVPVLNEATGITDLLGHLRNAAPAAQVVVADGGSTDETLQLAAEAGADVIVKAPRSRALQMNFGAASSNGDILWFVHADIRIPGDAIAEIQRLLSDPEVVGGFFRIRLPDPHFVYRYTDVVAHYLGLLLRMRCGDHGIFCRRQVFDEIGGFPDVPLMEDAEFFRRLCRRGKVRWSKSRLTVSTRRYQMIGPFRLTFFYGLIGGLYAVGVPLPRLAKMYSRFCASRKTDDCDLP